MTSETLALADVSDRMKLLIVEGNAEMRRLIKSLVGELAEEVYECGDGAAAVEAYRAHRPQFVLMDIEMGGTDGINATRAITAFDPRARVIIVTDYDDGEYRAAAREVGACGYVVKENLMELKRLLADPEGRHETIPTRRTDDGRTLS